MVYKQVDFIQYKSLGYDKDHLLTFEPTGKVVKKHGIPGRNLKIRKLRMLPASGTVWFPPERARGEYIGKVRILKEIFHLKLRRLIMI